MFSQILKLIDYFLFIPLKIKQALEDYEDLIDLRKAKIETVNEPGVSFNDVKNHSLKTRVSTHNQQTSTSISNEYRLATK